MSTATRIIWFDDNTISFRNDSTGHEFKSGDSITADSSSSNQYKITLKDTNKHWPTGTREIRFQQTDPENPVDPMYVNGFNTNLYSDHFSFGSNLLYSLFMTYATTANLDKENSWHFNGLLDSNNKVIQTKDIVTNNSNVTATSVYDMFTKRDNITIKAKPGYKITGVKMYTNIGGDYKFSDYTSSLNSSGNLNIYFSRNPIATTIDNDFYAKTPNVWGYYAKVTTIKTAVETVDLTFRYNNGQEYVTETKSAQAAGTITGTVKAASGYHITKVSGGHYTNQQGYSYNLSNFTATKISDSEYSYSFNLTNSDVSRLQKHPSNINLGVSTEKEAGNLTIDTSGLINCSITPSVVTQGKETAITLNANSGYILNGSGSLIVDGATNSFMCNNVASFPLTITANASVKITFTATKVETPPQSIIHTYILTQDGYNNLGKQVITAVNSTGSGFEQYDYTKFINYLYEFPFKIDNSITTSTNSIQLGKQSLNIAAQHVTHETVNINLGTIDLTAVKDSNDLKPVSIMLYCPFSEQVVLPSSVIGSKITLGYTCNIKAEQALLIVKQNGNIIYTKKTELFTDLPLYFTAGTQDTLIKQFKQQYQNTITQAYIRAVYHKPIQGITVFETKEHGKLETFKGFTRVSYGTLSQSISTEIDTMILQELKNGVIIK